MEHEKRKKPRTIQMRYPAPYSQSWTEADQDTRKIKKKSKSHNANSSNHAAPHSHSWANDRSGKRVKRKCSPRPNTQIVYPLPFTKITHPRARKVNTATSRRPIHKSDHIVENCCHMRPRIRGLDPTAPHLKYGIFNSAKKKGQVKVMDSTDHPSRTSTVEETPRKEKKKELKCPDPTIIAHMSPRRLSVTAPTHVDIRPQRY